MISLFEVNSLYQETKTKQFHRIVYSNLGTGLLYIISFNEKGKAKHFPTGISCEDFQKKIDNGDLCLEKEDPFLEVRNPDTLSAKQIQFRDNAYKIIGPLIRNIPNILNPKKRGKIVRTILDNYATDSVGKNKKAQHSMKMYIYRKLKQYFVRGSSRAALVPAFENCGAPGVIRIPGIKKRGTSNRRRDGKNPVKQPSNSGVNINVQDQKNFVTGVKRYLSIDNANSTIEGAYLDTITAFYGTKKRDGEIVVNWKKVPTIHQFRDWIPKLFQPSELLKIKKGLNEYEKNNRPSRSSANFNVFGPGHVYLIDPTTDNCHLNLSVNRLMSIGRANFYIVRDAFSRMVTGLHITTENTSYIISCLALENAASNKKDFAAKYGITITEDDWPCHHLPAILLADNADLVSKKASGIIEEFDIEFQYTASYRGDLKGLAERIIGLMQNRTEGLLKRKGGLDPKYGTRMGKDSRQYSNLTLDDLYHISILAILEYNNTQPLKKYVRTPEMIAENVKAVPIELWKWGISKGYQSFRAFDRRNFWKNMLPREKVSLYQKGIYFEGTFFDPIDKKMSEHIHELFLLGEKVTIAYDPRFFSEIYLIHKKEFYKLKPIELDPNAFANFYELRFMNQYQSAEMAEQEDTSKSAKVNTNEKIRARLALAKSKTPQGKKNVKGIRKNRNDENQLQRDKERQSRTSDEVTSNLQPTTQPKPALSLSEKYEQLLLGKINRN